jgi:serine/threonine protein kinase/tetratricopeptide (TPR) repeat protein
MSDDPRVEQLLHQILDSEHFPEDVCADCPELLEEVRGRWRQMRMLSAEIHAMFPSAKPDGDADASAPKNSPNEGPGTRIGPYKLLQKIGEGGFGIVYMAEQDKPVHRRLAFKIIKPGMDSAQVIARFEAERQALAMMDHQSIAKVFDAGTTDSGRPFFVMELVHGVRITKYCDDNHLTVRERLELVVGVCKAVQHAHQKGIIHRDLKPSNVLVSLNDGQPVPKIIDFGVAKAVEQRLTERTMFTEFGQIVGTYEYMSPEQAEMSHLGVDTRSDIYSLGVMLYELLTGSTPLARQRLRAAGLTEMLKIIKEEEPPRPSTRLSATQEAAQIAAARRTEPVRLGKLLRGELDWVVMKCLEKDRARRYATANAMARDIERYLHDEPVEAGPPGAGYRLKKLARKHRTALAIAGVIALLLVLAGAVSAWQAVRATLAEHRALAERDRAELEKDRAEQERNRAEASFKMARETVDRFFTQVADSPTLKAQGMEKFRKDLLGSAKEFYERFIREQLDAPQVRHDLGRAHVRLAKIQEVLGDHAAAQAMSERAIEILSALAREHPEATAYQSDLAKAHFGLGVIYSNIGRFDNAKSAHQQALAIQERLAGDHPGVAEYQRDLAITQSALGVLYYRAGHLDKSQASQEQALVTWNQLLGNNAHLPEDRHGLASAQYRLGATYVDRGQSEKAEATLTEAASTYQAMVADYPDVPEYRQSLGSVYSALGGLYLNNMRRADKAEAVHEQARQIFEKLALEHPDVLGFGFEVGNCYANLAFDAEVAGRRDTAMARSLKAIEILEPILSRGYGQARVVIFDVGIFRAAILAGRGDHVQATKEANAMAQRAGLGNVNLYNIACVFCRASTAAGNDGKLAPAERNRLKAQYSDRAIEFLRRSVAGGFQDATAMKADPDLAPLRSREDFRKLVQEVERKSKK